MSSNRDKCPKYTFLASFRTSKVTAMLGFGQKRINFVLVMDTMKIRSILLLFAMVVATGTIQAYSLRQFSSRNGLSNSAILSLCQDRYGFMWFGTCDGLNMFDGVNFQVYKPTDSANNLSGNLIENIVETGDGIFWIQTNYGLDRFDSRKRTIRTFGDFKEKNKLLHGPDNAVYILKEDNNLYYYEAEKDSFDRVFVKGLAFDDILATAIDSENMLWAFLRDGSFLSYSIGHGKKGLELTPRDSIRHEERLLFCSYEDNLFYFVDEAYALYEYDVIAKKKSYIKDIQAEMQKYGNISSIIKHRDDYFIGFKSNGLIHLQNTPDQKTRFIVHEVDIKSGIFCLKKDRFQDIVWVGTDGQGVYMYFTDQYSIHSTLLEKMDYALNNPVRALYIDRFRNLWMGTKGDGIVKVAHYDVFKNAGTASCQYLTANSALKDNSVYAFAPSKKDILWIGSENGLNYYSYKEQIIKEIPLTAGDKPVRYVHSICEFNDTTLWIATVGEGVVKATLKEQAGKPVLVNARRFVFGNGKHSTNYFFTAYKENDSIIWFGNRGYGAYRMNNNTHAVRAITFDDKGVSQTFNDIFSINKTDEGYWFGTSFGLVRLYEGHKQFFGETNGFPNNTIHGILKDHRQNLWLSTNQGVVKFNTVQNTIQTYRQQNELEVTEFSDGAYFRDAPTGALLFGGVNGFITILENEVAQAEYHPSIHFTRLSIFGKECNIDDFIKSHKSRQRLTLTNSQNFFSVAFIGIDYINGKDYTYYYKINELSNNWIENGSSNWATFTNISPGDYTLEVKYRNNITGKESEIQSLAIRILPPWYLTNLAYVVYTLLVLAVLAVIIRFAVKWYKMKRDSMMEKLNRQQREEVYESKLRFFTNITHELCTPLTLISGPCERIISYRISDAYIKKYAMLIRHNADKLNSLIQELIEFRRLETGHKKREVRSIPVSGQVTDIAGSFNELAESRGLDYQLSVPDDIVWNTDSGCLSKIVTNLISNAFKYTPDNGKIKVGVGVEGGKLTIAVSNTGKGIKQEDIPKIFDRYTILDNLEAVSKKGTPSRNGLGLAICYSMVKLLEGEIDVTSTLNEVTTFTVVLPGLEADAETAPQIVIDNAPALKPEQVPVLLKGELPEFNKQKHTLMVVDDDPSMLWFVAEIFAEHYNVVPVNDSRLVMDQLKQYQPDLIISDVMMPGCDGISLTRSIKADKILSHIPLILLSAKRDMEEQVKGIESGAEVYITKPFNVEYLKKIVERMISQREELRQYYNSALSAFEISDGRMMHKEDKAFFEKVIGEINNHIADPNFSVEMLSTSLAMSTRQFYRKLKTFTEKTPNDIIREYRLGLAEKLLVTTNLSVEEIMYKSGFANRGNFFKLFLQKYGMTPKSYRNEKREEVEDGMAEN